MITSTAPVQIAGQLHGEKIAMGFDPNSLPHLQGILSAMYGDDELACIREYTCNGRDATIEAGSSRPVEVTTPNPMSPFLKIRDYGCGLSTEDIRSIFSQYGASTKRDSNDQTGCLGIGSKSALAYTSSFTVSSVKDGKRVEVAVSLNDLGAGEITVMADGVPSDEPNGTEVSIPAKRMHSFESKARSLFQYWPKGSVLLNGAEVPQVPEALVLSDKTATIRVDGPNGTTRDVRIDKMVIRDTARQSVILMGGVPYPIPDELNNLDLPHGKSVVVWVGMGEVNFAPSREALRRTLHTQQALDAIHLHFDARAQKAVQKSIDDAKTPGGALRLMLKWKGLMPERIFDHKYTYNGLDMPGTFSLNKDEGLRGVVVEQHSYKLNAHSRQVKVMASTGLNAVWFFNYDKEFTSGQRKKINYWADQQDWSSYPMGSEPNHYILVTDKPDMTFLDSGQVFDYMQVIDPIRVPRASGGGSYGPTGRIPGSYDFYEGETFREGVPGDEIDTDNPVYYFVRDRWTSAYDARPYVRKVTHFEADCTTVVLTSNRVDKFCRLFPKAVTVQARARTLTQEWLDTVPESTKEILGFQARVDSGKFKPLKGHVIKDPAIRATLSRLERLSADQGLTKVAEEANLLGVGNFAEHSKWVDPLTDKKYPLAFTTGYYKSFRDDSIEHVIAYINAVHKS